MIARNRVMNVMLTRSQLHPVRCDTFEVRAREVDLSTADAPKVITVLNPQAHKERIFSDPCVLPYGVLYRSVEGTELILA